MAKSLTQVEGIFGNNIPAHLKGTPVHTAMQIKYLDDPYRWHVACVVLGRYPLMDFEHLGSPRILQVYKPILEDFTDVSFDYTIQCPGEIINGKINIELKPDMGDNWPRVLQQIHAQRERMRKTIPFGLKRETGKWILQLGSYVGSRRVDIIKKAFSNSDIYIFFTDELEREFT